LAQNCGKTKSVVGCIRVCKYDINDELNFVLMSPLNFVVSEKL